MPRTDRGNNELRPISIERRCIKNALGSATIAFGDTRVLCTATLDDRVPPFLRDTGTGWVTAEYAMLPASASGGRVPRSAARKGRAMEISRLIGRSLRSITRLDLLGERQVVVDCDVIQADGGTRTAAITGGYIALNDALAELVRRGDLKVCPIAGQCAAISVGVVKGEILLDLCYEEDSAADVDLNLVMKDDGGIIEIQGTAEGEAFDRKSLDEMIDFAQQGIERLFENQREALSVG